MSKRRGESELQRMLVRSNAKQTASSFHGRGAILGSPIRYLSPWAA